MISSSFPKFVFTFILLSLFTSPLMAQGGSGDLPPVPKSTNKTKPKAPAKPKTTSKALPKSVSAKEPAKVDPIYFDQAVEGKLESASSGRIPPTTYYQDYVLSATDADLFSIQLNTVNPFVKVEILDEKKNELPLKRVEQSGEFRLNTSGFTFPENGDYRIRVIASLQTALSQPISYNLKLVHTGLTAAGYQDRLQKIIAAFNLPGERKVDETISQLERLTQDDPKQPGGFEYLGMIYNEYKKDLPKASVSMLEAIKQGGNATFKITHDSQWRRPVREKKGARMVWEDQRTDWLKISAKQLVIVDFSTSAKTMMAFAGTQIKDAGLPPGGVYLHFTHLNKTIKPMIITVGFSSQAEAEIALDLIKGNLLRKE